LNPRRWGAVVWISAVQFFIAQIVAQAAWTAPFSLRSNFISDLGNTVCGFFPTGSESYVCSPWHAGMNASFIFLGLTIVLGIALLCEFFPKGTARTAGCGLLIAAGLGNVAVGVFPENENGLGHKLGAVIYFILGNIGMVSLGFALRRDRDRSGLAAFSRVSGAVGLSATALFLSDHYLGIGIGGMERVAAYPLPIWLIAAGLAILLSGKKRSDVRS
jgi:hypothetical membrane protein